MLEFFLNCMARSRMVSAKVSVLVGFVFLRRGSARIFRACFRFCFRSCGTHALSFLVLFGFIQFVGT